MARRPKRIRFVILNLGIYEDTYHSELVLCHPDGFKTVREALLSLRRHFGSWFVEPYSEYRRRGRPRFVYRHWYFTHWVRDLIQGNFQNGDIDSEFNNLNCSFGDGWLSRGASLLLIANKKLDLVISVGRADEALNRANKIKDTDELCQYDIRLCDGDDNFRELGKLAGWPEGKRFD